MTEQNEDCGCNEYAEETCPITECPRVKMSPKMPDLIEPLIGPVTSMHPENLMKNKELEGATRQAKFLQFGMPQLRLDQNRMSNPDIQAIVKTLRKDAKQKPNARARRAAKIAAGKLIVVSGKLVGGNRNDNVVHEGDPNFDWAALQRLRKDGEGLY